MTFTQKLTNYYKAGYPALMIQSHEERRIMLEIAEMAKATSGMTLMEWDSQNGLVVKVGKSTAISEESSDPGELFKFIQNYSQEKTIFVLKDLHLQFEKQNAKIQCIRFIKNSINVLKARQNTLIFVSPKYSLPVELEKEIQLIEYALPDETAIQERLTFIHNSVNKSAGKTLEMPIEVEERAIEAARGMTFSEIENAYSLAVVENKGFNSGFVRSVFQEKVMQVKKNGLLNYIEPDVTFDDIGGLDGLKTWFLKRKKGFSKAARKYRLPNPKGALLCGVPGMGKTMIAKACAAEFNAPLFQLDIGKLFGGKVGETEGNFRSVISILDAIGHCVLLLDEVEKNLNTAAVSGQGDTGTSSRAFGTWLSWMSDSKSPVFKIATSNDHTKLPAEFTRKGRLDEMFWIDLPTEEGLKDIWTKVIKKFGRNPKDFSMKKLVNNSKDFTGAEVEEAFISAMYAAFDVDKEVDDSYVIDELLSFNQYAKVHKDKLEEMRRNANGKLKIATDSGEPEDFEKAMRKIDIQFGN